MQLIALFSLARLAYGNVYLHSPRGSNNRLNEPSAANFNDERLFRSNNNRRGGYNVGDKTFLGFQNEDGQYSMQYFQSGVEGNSYLTVEWTNLLGCGKDEDGDKIHNCEIVIQTTCQNDEVDGIPPSDSYTLRNGRIPLKMPYEADPNDALSSQLRHLVTQDHHDVPEVKIIPDSESGSSCCERSLATMFTNFFQSYTSNTNNRRTVAVESREEKNERRSVSENESIGLHESWEYYDRCSSTSVIRYGMECLSERQQWPDTNISPWVDVAYFSDEPENSCSNAIETLNQRQFFECVEYYDEHQNFRKHKSLHKSELECINNGGDWLGFYKVGDVREDIESPTECLQLNGGLKEHVWGRPMSWRDLAEDKLTDETCIALPAKTECHATPSTRHNYLGSVDGKQHAPRFQWTLPHHEAQKRCVFRIRYIITSEDDQITPGDRRVYPFGADSLSLAPAQQRVVFEDRSHIFKLLQRPDEIPDQLNIHNLVVRGKRGNIVQTYPAVEYDFVPNRLTIPEGDAIHVQWTGSNTHDNNAPAGDGQAGDAGEGVGGTDRHNFVQLLDRAANLMAPDHKHTLFENADWVWSSHEKGYPENAAFNMALSMATSGYYQCETGEECEEAYDNSLDQVLNNAPASYHGNVFIPSTGEYHYKCTRNDNFSNRSQKGTIMVVS